MELRQSHQLSRYGKDYNVENVNISMHCIVIMLPWSLLLWSGVCPSPAWSSLVRYSLCWLSVTSPANSGQQRVILTGPRCSWWDQPGHTITISTILSDLPWPAHQARPQLNITSTNYLFPILCSLFLSPNFFLYSIGHSSQSRHSPTPRSANSVRGCAIKSARI